ncbi:MAG TPA: hypothetical protein VJJ52_04775 [Candidatus Nanoarchaeia archaeon]|nr:hypothetical protein [Candidatus Nanoarchaeia archaeon]
MPQPITHLLLERKVLGNFLGDAVHQGDIYREEWTSFGQDIFYVKDIIRHTHPQRYNVVSDTFHWDGSYDEFCSELDILKSKRNEDRDGSQKTDLDQLGADIYRRYLHAVGDLIFHPFVYRAAKDHWRNHPSHEYRRHKVIESIIDAYLLDVLEGTNPYEFRYNDHSMRPHTSLELDDNLFEVVNSGIKLAYGKSGIFAANGVDYEKYFGRYSSDDPNHPLRDAYRDFIFYTELLFAFHKPLRHISGLDCLVPLEKINDDQIRLMNQDRKQWYLSDNPEMPRYSVLELLNLAVKVGTKIVQASERFLASDFAISHDFFAIHANNVVYLGQNFNLDTGLPSSENLALVKLATIDETLRYGVDMLAANYKTIENYV